MQPLYIEPSDEITTVIGRMKESDDKAIALVVPKGAILLQSVVNLKLAKRAAAEAGKELSIITTDKIGRNLCKQVGISSFSRLNDKNIPESDNETEEEDSHVINGVKVHRYYEGEATPEEESGEEITPIVPKEIMKEEKAEAEPEESPIKIRPVTGLETEQKTQAPTEVSKAGNIASITTVDVPSEASSERKDDDKPHDQVIKPNISTVDARSKKQSPLKKRRYHPLVLITYLVIILLLIVGAAGAYFLPQTTVTIAVKATAWTQQATLTAKSGGTIPVQTLTATTTDTLPFKGTGSQDIGNKATGSATLYNSLGTVVTLPAGAIITANNQNFTTNAAATIPAATASVEPDGTPVITPGSVNVNITAQNSGTASNMSSTSGTITSPATKSYARIISTSGGTSQLVTLISATDISTAQQAVTTQLKTDVLAKLTTQMKGTDYIFNDQNDNYAISNFSASVAAGTQANTANATATVTLTRLAVNQKTLETIAQSQAMSAEKAPNTTLTIDHTTVTSSSFDQNAETASVVLTTFGHISPTIDPNSLKNNLSGKKLNDGVNLIKTTAKNNTYVVQQTPSWWPLRNFPLSKRFLKVNVTYE